jgi:hypothetical protein
MEEGHEKAEIKKPWCTYSCGLGPSGFGKIVRDEKTSVNIKYSEEQMYAPECWDPAYVTRFDTLDEAVEYYIENRLGVDIRDRQLTPDEVRENAWKDFPSYYKNKKN